MIKKQDFRQEYDKNTHFVILDATNNYMEYNSFLTLIKRMVYINKCAADGQIAFAFETINSSIKIYKSGERYTLKWYNCNHEHPACLNGVGYKELDSLDVNNGGFQWEHYYACLEPAIQDAFKAVLMYEVNITVYGTMDTQKYSKDFIINNKTEDFIRYERLSVCYYSQSKLF